MIAIHIEFLKIQIPFKENILILLRINY
jgi:hypothetical protein